eukprot:s233_g13.t1
MPSAAFEAPNLAANRRPRGSAAPMEDQEQVLGAATLLAIERLEKMTKQSKDGAAPEPPKEALLPVSQAAQAAWRYMPSVGTWAVRRVVPAHLPKFPVTPRQAKSEKTEKKVASASPKVLTLRRSPRHTAPPAPVRMGQKEKVEKMEKAHTDKVLQKSPKVPSLRDVRPSASAPTLLAGVTRLPQVKPPVKRSPQSSSVAEAKARSKPSPRPVVRSMATRPALSTAEIEARQIEEKRKQAKFLAEKNARHMARAQVKDPVKPHEAVKKPTTPATATTATTARSAEAKPNSEIRSPTQRNREVKGEASAPRGVKVATAPTPARNTISQSAKGASKGTATPTVKTPSPRPVSQDANGTAKPKSPAAKPKLVRPPSPLARSNSKGSAGSKASNGSAPTPVTVK